MNNNMYNNEEVSVIIDYFIRLNLWNKKIKKLQENLSRFIVDGIKVDNNKSKKYFVVLLLGFKNSFEDPSV